MAEIKKETKQSVLYRLMENSRRARSIFMKEGRELQKFTSRRTGPGNSEYAKEEFWNAKVARTDEAVEIFGPYLYQQPPARTVSLEEGAAEGAIAEKPAVEKLLNQGQQKTKANYHNKKVVRSAVAWGRGVIKTGLSKKGYPSSKWLHVSDYLEDPDATIPEDVKWKAGRRLVKRFLLREQIPKRVMEINSLTKYSNTASDNDVEVPETQTGKFGDEGIDNGNQNGNVIDNQRFYHEPMDLIEVWDIYMLVGLANFKGGQSLSNLDLNDDDKKKNAKVNNSPKKYTVAWQGGNVVLLRESDWEIPFWRTDDFPFSNLDLVEDDELLQPKSPLLPGLGWQRAMNDIVQLALAKSSFNLRDIFFLLRRAGVEIEANAEDKILNGGDQEIITVNADDPNVTIKDIFQQAQPEPMSQEFDRIMAILREQYQRATGLYDILFTGQTATQARSAKESSLREQRSLSRIEEMRLRVEEWSTTVAEKEAFTARFMLDRQDVIKLIGPKLGSLWRDLLPPVEIHLQEMQQEILQQIPDLDPNDPRIRQVIEQRVMLERQQGVTFDEWINEYSFTIVGDSMRRKDRNQQISLADTLMNQTLSAVAGIGTPQSMQVVAGIIKFSMDANGADGELLDIVNKMVNNIDMLVQQQEQQVQQDVGAQQQINASSNVATGAPQ